MTRGTMGSMADCIDPSRLIVWVQTWYKRDGVRDKTLASLEASDVGKNYEVVRQPEGECCVNYYVRAMKRFCRDYDWILRIEDDTIVNRHLLHNVCTWPAPHGEPKFGMGFLSVTHPVLKDAAHIGYGEKHKTPWRNYRGMHFGGGMLYKADLFRERAGKIKRCMCQWHPKFAAAVCPSAALFDDGYRAYFHLPSLVRIDLAIPRSLDGKVVDESKYGTQPFDENWRRK